VPAGFTAEELRREYRQLALRFHPDRHADQSALEREQRARNFAEAADLYRCLRAVVAPRH
jgi:DnaJ-class molecular chaperone